MQSFNIVSLHKRMFKILRKISLLALIAIINFSSCTYEKRVYRPGYHLVWNHTKKQSIKNTGGPDTLPLAQVAPDKYNSYGSPLATNGKNKTTAPEKENNIIEKLFSGTPDLNKFFSEKLHQRNVSPFQKKSFTRKLMRKTTKDDTGNKSMLKTGLIILGVGLMIILISLIAGSTTAQYWSEAQNGCMHVVLFLLGVLLVIIGVVFVCVGAFG